ncbi:MAG: hypothetical protein ABR915_21910, partial [Thermoguttaceae bacterium]
MNPWYLDEATNRQMKVLKFFDVCCTQRFSKGEASRLITRIFLILQHHFAIGDFGILSHIGGVVDRTGQFGGSWKSSGGLYHGY